MLILYTTNIKKLRGLSFFLLNPLNYINQKNMDN